MKKGLAILGSTGSIGKNTLDVVRNNKNRFRIVSLAAMQNLELLIEQIKEFEPSFVAIVDREKGAVLKEYLNNSKVKVGIGLDSVTEVAVYDGVDLVVAAITGSAGLIPVYSALKNGIDVALANKEALVLGGKIIIREAGKSGSNIIPIDSEHCALFQASLAGKREEVRRFILTASGGPFFDTSFEDFARITPEEALKHPKWDMGAKVTLDSATFVNKGLEVIEASRLFDIEPEKIDVVIHPEAIVHSMVEFVDGSIIAQLGPTDMRLPIQYAITWPDRIASHVKPISFSRAMTLKFLPRDDEKFPALPLAYEALHKGGSGTIAYSAADEIAVEAFLKGDMRFDQIPLVITEVLNKIDIMEPDTIDDILKISNKAEKMASSLIRELAD